ncbi:hypothetical protein HPB52_019718 [Rhipicephalus sanguineus]|uniref:Nuclease HARBI1 n=1 Tax=Rhipicephalus sanguineus TaxID=34632 RepID=A0A9D4PXE3_RHISA|nr:hypothetical protein HPB52_019718 [Rhipicephalus sanguineus]
MLRLLMALRFYGADTFQTVTGDLVRIPQSTVCRAVGKVTLLIAKHFHSTLVRFPQPAGFPKIMRDFYELAEFPRGRLALRCLFGRQRALLRDISANGHFSLIRRLRFAK